MLTCEQKIGGGGVKFYLFYNFILAKFYLFYSNCWCFCIYIGLEGEKVHVHVDGVISQSDSSIEVFNRSWTQLAANIENTDESEF